MSFLQSTGKIITTYPFSVVTAPEYSQLFSNIAYFFKILLNLFNSDFFGLRIGTGSYHLILRLLFLMVLFFGLLMNAKTIFRGTFNKILLFCIIVQIAAAIFANDGRSDDWMAHPNWASRLLMPLFFSLVLLFAQIDWRPVTTLIKFNISNTWYKVFGIAAMLLLFASNLQEQSLSFKGSDYSFKESMRLKPLADTLINKGLTKGFGTFWLAGVTTVNSDFKVDVRPVLGKDLSYYAWLSKRPTDWDEAHFVILDKSKWGDVTEESVIESIGMPDEKIMVNDATILIWNKNIMPYIIGSGYPKQIIRWWSIEEGETKKEIDVTNKHFASHFAADADGYFTSAGAGHVVFGPYKPIDAGTYDITFEFEYKGTLKPGEVIGSVDVNSNTQKVKPALLQIKAGETRVTLKDVSVLPECHDFETRVYANVSGITVRKLIIERKTNSLKD